MRDVIYKNKVVIVPDSTSVSVVAVKSSTSPPASSTAWLDSVLKYIVLYSSHKVFELIIRMFIV